VGAVADRDDQAWWGGHVVERAGDGVGQVDTGSSGGGDGTPMHAAGRMGAGTRRRRVGDRPPEHSGELRASRVRRADEERRLRRPLVG
jgi:hypothetical protein